MSLNQASNLVGTGAGRRPDFFGAAILDNIDVNGALVGQGPTNAD